MPAHGVNSEQHHMFHLPLHTISESEIISYLLLVEATSAPARVCYISRMPRAYTKTSRLYTSWILQEQAQQIKQNNVFKNPLDFCVSYKLRKMAIWGGAAHTTLMQNRDGEDKAFFFSPLSRLPMGFSPNKKFKSTEYWNSRNSIR